MAKEDEKSRIESVQIAETKGKEEGIEIGDSIGRQEGREERNTEVAINMLKENADHEFIARVTGYTLDEILKLQNKL